MQSGRSRLAADGPVGDTLRAYLARISRKKLLTRDREVEIAKRIEQGHHEAQTAVFESPAALADIEELCGNLDRKSVV